jgi:bacterial/archaeal transporter family protein
MTWQIYALLSAVAASFVAIFGKIGLANIDSTLATAVRAIVMAVFLFFVTFFLGKFDSFESIKGKALIFIVLSGIAGALSWLAYFYAIKIAPVDKVGSVASIDKLSVVFVFVLSILFLGSKFSMKTAIGALCVSIGAILMI